MNNWLVFTWNVFSVCVWVCVCVSGILIRTIEYANFITGEEEEIESIEEVTRQIYAMHSALLSKGMALSHLPTIHEALEGNLPYR